MLGLTAALMAVSDGNPFAGHSFYVQPSFQKKVDSSIATAQGVTELTNLKKMRSTATAFWVDKKAKISDGTSTDHLEGMLADAAKQSPAPLVTIVVYNLPNRDCDSVRPSNSSLTATNTKAARPSCVALADMNDRLTLRSSTRWAKSAARTTPLANATALLLVSARRALLSTRTTSLTPSQP